MSTQTESVTELMESLDFEPGCDVGHRPGSPYEPCPLPADWIAVRACCEKVLLYCEPHIRFVTGPAPRRRWSCPDCGWISPDAYFPHIRIERIR